MAAANRRCEDPWAEKLHEDDSDEEVVGEVAMEPPATAAIEVRAMETMRDATVAVGVSVQTKDYFLNEDNESVRLGIWWVASNSVRDELPEDDPAEDSRASFHTEDSARRRLSSPPRRVPCVSLWSARTRNGGMNP